MASILSFRGNEHRRTQLVLPWYATGRLDQAESVQVENHLAQCAACRGDLQIERDMAARVAGLTFGADSGWAGLRQRLQNGARPSGQNRAVGAIQRWLAWPGKFGWFVAGQALAAGIILMLAPPSQSPPAAYHALSAVPTHAPGNAIVIFRPDTTEADIRAALDASRARIVDGPTASGAYVLRVAAEQRDEILTELRSRRSIVLAQPIDGDPEQ